VSNPFSKDAASRAAGKDCRKRRGIKGNLQFLSLEGESKNRLELGQKGRRLRQSKKLFSSEGSKSVRCSKNENFQPKPIRDRLILLVRKEKRVYLEARCSGTGTSWKNEHGEMEGNCNLMGHLVSNQPEKQKAERARDRAKGWPQENAMAEL